VRPVPEPVRRAMSLFERGKFEEAAKLFDELAQDAEEQGQLFRAAHLGGQAARCYLQLDDVDAAYERATKALDLFKQAERPGAARRLGESIVKVLKDKGRQAEAEALERKLRQLPAPARPGARRGELPGKCPQCGGPIKETEADWIGPSSVECPYCGSVVKAE
jgi:thioredoxin-like negative regulator of GroEL/DNA-directed RNA polymerase subunit RPC12/RpoP